VIWGVRGLTSALLLKRGVQAEQLKCHLILIVHRTGEKTMNIANSRSRGSDLREQSFGRLLVGGPT
jgi:hypothetical protein